jgi:FxsC-like protein
MAFFFFSYARNDAEDKYLRKFYNELTIEIAGRLGSKANDIGFLDINLPPGTVWAEGTARAIASCKVFIPAYSPSFFKSNYCGKEWHCFQRRLEDCGASTELILPVWWLPPEPHLASTVEHIQDFRDGHGNAYRDRGLRFLRQLKHNRADYQKFLAKFAEQAVAAATRNPLSDGNTPDLRQSPNAFLGAANRPTSASTEPGSGGPKWVRFIVVAGSREQMEQHRTNLHYYGDEWDGWQPYHPDYEDPIGIHAQRIANVQRFYSDSRVADAGLLKVVREAERRREIVVLLIDSWATRITDYSALLAKYDCEQFENTAIVIPSNHADEETSSRLDRLRAELFLSLKRCMNGDNRFFREDARTVKEFECALQEVIVEVRRRIFESHPPVRRAGMQEPHRRPQISGPGG